MRNSIEKALEAALVIIFSATVLTVTWQVIGRYILAAPSSTTEEIARFLLIWLGTLSTAYAFAKRMHVGVDVISAKLSPQKRKYLVRLIWSICLIFALTVFIYGGGALVRINLILGQTSSAMGFPMWAVYTILPISGCIIAYYSIINLIEAITDDDEMSKKL